MREIIQVILAGLAVGLVIGFNSGFYLGNNFGQAEVASGKVVCQQALGEWVCKPKDEVK